MKWEIKSDYQHQEFYRRVLDELEDRWIDLREEYLNTHWRDPSVEVITRKYDRARKNYQLVKQRYDVERFTRRWGH